MFYINTLGSCVGYANSVLLTSPLEREELVYNYRNSSLLPLMLVRVESN